MNIEDLNTLELYNLIQEIDKTYTLIVFNGLVIDKKLKFEKDSFWLESGFIYEFIVEDFFEDKILSDFEDGFYTIYFKLENSGQGCDLFFESNYEYHVENFTTIQDYRKQEEEKEKTNKLPLPF